MMNARTVKLPENIDNLTEEQLDELDDEALEAYQSILEERVRIEEENSKKAQQAALEQKKALEEREAALKTRLVQIDIETKKSEDIVKALQAREIIIDKEIARCDERTADLDKNIAERNKR